MFCQNQCITSLIATSCLKSAPKPSIPIGIMSKHSKFLSEQGGCDHWEKDLSESNVDLSLVVPVYHNSLKKYQVMNSLIKEKLMQGASKIASFKESQPYKIMADLSDTPTDKSTLEIETYSLSIIPVSPDGNCFFAAVFMTIKLSPNLNFEAFSKRQESMPS